MSKMEHASSTLVVAPLTSERRHNARVAVCEWALKKEKTQTSQIAAARELLEILGLR